MKDPKKQNVIISNIRLSENSFNNPFNNPFNPFDKLKMFDINKKNFAKTFKANSGINANKGMYPL